MKRKLDVQPGEVLVTGAGKAGINNSDLATYLVQDQSDALSDLSTLYGAVTPAEISISDDGVVYINNESFKKFAKNLIANPVVPVAGWGCANGACTKVMM